MKQIEVDIMERIVFEKVVGQFWMILILVHMSYIFTGWAYKASTRVSILLIFKEWNLGIIQSHLRCIELGSIGEARVLYERSFSGKNTPVLKRMNGQHHDNERNLLGYRD